MGKAKILIVDDRPENLLTLESLLERDDIELVRAESGEDALAQTLDHDFALILMDVQMPGMSGYEVAELMRGSSKTRHVPIIFITAAAKVSSQVFKAYEAGAVDYLFKPLDVVAFKSKVGVFIDLYQHKEALRTKSEELDRKLVELEELQQQLEETNEQLLLLSTTDGLTGLLNKRRFDELLEEEWSRGLRTKKPLSLLLVDIDHFKRYNDNYGHLRGDDTLRQVAEALASSVLRSSDKLARIGGEEFAVILPETDIEGALDVANRLRHCVAQLGIPHMASDCSAYLTASVGVTSQVPERARSVRELFEIADSALYEAKAQGRNRSYSLGSISEYRARQKRAGKTIPV